MTDKSQLTGSNNNLNGNGFNCNLTNNNVNGNNGHPGPKNRICRDFIRGFCRRQNCRFPHVPSTELVIFCHDYQNAGCSRPYCKFLHYTLQEEEHYKQFGEFPQNFNEFPQNFGEFPQNFSNGSNGIDTHDANNIQNNGNFNGSMLKSTMLKVCQEYMMNRSCRHRECHVASPPQPPNRNSRPSREKHNDLPMWNDNSNSQFRRNGEYRDEFLNLNRLVCTGDKLSLDSSPQLKRLRSSVSRQSSDDNSECLVDILAVIRRLDEEQAMLRRRVETNELKIAELRANNEYLMAQNAQLRLNSHVHAQQQQLRCAVTQAVTQTTSQPLTPQTVMTATPIVSIATPQTQIITSSGTPLAIAAANTSQAQQLAITQQNITTLSNGNQPGILGTSQITLAPAITQGPSMGLTINTSQALAMSNATQPIISYPVMTHSILPH